MSSNIGSATVQNRCTPSPCCKSTAKCLVITAPTKLLQGTGACLKATGLGLLWLGKHAASAIARGAIVTGKGTVGLAKGSASLVAGTGKLLAKGTVALITHRDAALKTAAVASAALYYFGMPEAVTSGYAGASDAYANALANCEPTDFANLMGYGRVKSYLPETLPQNVSVSPTTAMAMFGAGVVVNSALTAAAAYMDKPAADLNPVRIANLIGVLEQKIHYLTNAIKVKNNWDAPVKKEVTLLQEIGAIIIKLDAINRNMETLKKRDIWKETLESDILGSPVCKNLLFGQFAGRRFINGAKNKVPSFLKSEGRSPKLKIAVISSKVSALKTALASLDVVNAYPEIKTKAELSVKLTQGAVQKALTKAQEKDVAEAVKLHNEIKEGENFKINVKRSFDKLAIEIKEIDSSVEQLKESKKKLKKQCYFQQSSGAFADLEVGERLEEVKAEIADQKSLFSEKHAQKLELEKVFHALENYDVTKDPVVEQLQQNAVALFMSVPGSVANSQPLALGAVANNQLLELSAVANNQPTLEDATEEFIKNLSIQRGPKDIVASLKGRLENIIGIIMDSGAIDPAESKNSD